MWALTGVFGTIGCLTSPSADSDSPPVAINANTDDVAESACTTDTDCGAEAPLCCEGSCFSLNDDPNHCGACNQRCDAGEYCSRQSSCEIVSLRSICSNGSLIGLLDGDSTDEDAVRRLLSHYRQRCAGQTSTQGASDTSLFNPAGQPLAGVGTTLLAAGGGYRQPVVRYLDLNGLSPFFTDQQDNGATARLVRRDTGEVVAEVETAAPAADQDVFVSYLVEDPEGGSLLWVAYGLFAHGTQGAALWLTEIAPNLFPLMDIHWAAVRWSDTDHVPGPTPDDTFDIILISP